MRAAAVRHHSTSNGDAAYTQSEEGGRGERAEAATWGNE